jgi:hypothetical protein
MRKVVRMPTWLFRATKKTGVRRVTAAVEQASADLVAFISGRLLSSVAFRCVLAIPPALRGPHAQTRESEAERS